MTAAHTPGPWRISASSEAEGTYVVGCEVTTSDVSAWSVVAKVHGVFGAKQANANLIAAAPELLRTVDWLRQTYHRAHHDGDLETCPKNTCQAALAAIAKATGGVR